MSTAFERAFAEMRPKLTSVGIMLMDDYSARWRNEWAKVDKYTPKAQCRVELNRIYKLAKADQTAEAQKNQVSLL